MALISKENNFVTLINIFTVNPRGKNNLLIC